MNEILLQDEGESWLGGRLLKRLVWSAAGSCALGGLYAWRLEKQYLRIERQDMFLAGLASQWEGSTLAHIADLHCSPIVLDSYLQQCVEAVNELSVDLVAITGDFITGPACYARRVGRILRDLRPRVGTVACLGNHDYGLFHPTGLGSTRGLSDQLTGHLLEANVQVLRNGSKLFQRGGARLQVVGLEDLWSDRFDPVQAFDAVQPGTPVLALCHNPDAAHDLAQRGAQWVLAGHTHGTAFNANRLRKLTLPHKHHYHAGLYELAPGRSLYVNRGLGYGRRVNLNSRPEITVFTLKRAV